MLVHMCVSVLLASASQLAPPPSPPRLPASHLFSAPTSLSVELRRARAFLRRLRLLAHTSARVQEKTSASEQETIAVASLAKRCIVPCLEQVVRNDPRQARTIRDHHTYVHLVNRLICLGDMQRTCGGPTHGDQHKSNVHHGGGGCGKHEP